MALRALALGLLLIGCRLEKPPPEQPEVHRGAGWAAQVPPRATVRAEGATLAVDAADGSWWYDVRWSPASPVPQVAAMAWADERCRPMRWDAALVVTDGVWTSGGVCSIGERRFWVLVSVETVGDRMLMTGLMSSFVARGYEDVWVRYLTQALSVAPGEAPVEGLAADELRGRLRQINPDDGSRDQLPLPGGGTFTARVNAALRDVWEARRVRLASAPPPASFGGG